MSGPDEAQKSRDVLAANVALHSRLADDYQRCEPHFRPENTRKVEGRLRGLFERTAARRVLDLGCGTGFIIDLAKRHVPVVHGVDATPAMLERVDRSGDASIDLFLHDTGTFEPEPGSYDVVTAYSFLHHLYDVAATLRTAHRALRPGGIFYADLEPNYHFWAAIHDLDRHGDYDFIVRREIEMVTYKDEDIEKTFGVEREVFNLAEYGKNVRGGFREEDLRALLQEVGFGEVEVFYEWFVGQGELINAERYPREERFRYAEAVDDLLHRAMPLSRHLFKYLGLTAVKC
jgi:SAM-dependent methyltransferase